LGRFHVIVFRFSDHIHGVLCVCVFIHVLCRLPMSIPALTRVGLSSRGPWLFSGAWWCHGCWVSERSLLVRRLGVCDQMRLACWKTRVSISAPQIRIVMLSVDNRAGARVAQASQTPHVGPRNLSALSPPPKFWRRKERFCSNLRPKQPAVTMGLAQQKKYDSRPLTSKTGYQFHAY
jgi:hypothetical protein